MSAYLHHKYGKKYLLPDGLFDIVGPISKQVYGQFMPQAIKWPEHRDGLAYKGKDLIKFTAVSQWAANTEQALMNITEQLEHNYESAASLWERYKQRLTEFRSAVKNDVSSLDAAARKSTEATNKMVAAYGHVIETLNSEAMEKAVNNAERLAAAMHALSKMESHRLVLSVTERDKAP